MERFLQVRELHRPDADVVCIYVEGYLFQDFTHWSNSRWGKRIQKRLSKKKYRNFLKCIFFDNNALTNEPTMPCIRKNLMECMMNWTYDLFEQENVKCFTVCDQCQRMCTIKFHFDCIPICHKTRKQCTDCVAERSVQPLHQHN